MQAMSQSQIEISNGRKIDDVDKVLSKLDGRIVRKPDPMMCHHGANQKCTNCLPLDPYDESYLREKDIKHLSFHAYVRKLTDLHGKGTRSKNILENVCCKLQANCQGGHAPYPKGICTKCRPSTLTLNRQPFRHVDNIEFENADIVNNFLDFWRRSSYQRIGYLIGRHEQFSEVPLGIKNVVYAIYEPPQHSAEDSVILEEDPYEERIDQLSSWLGMRRVGWIFTDLWTEDARQGTVQCIRNEESFLLSAAECITAGDFQSKHKNYTEYCGEGHFGSKFATVVASGNTDKRIGFHGYQVSNQCTAMVEANILCPTNYPELAWAREKPLNEAQYITDVEYTEKDEYGNEVRRNGRPMPVEYLLVDVPCGVRKQEQHSFAATSKATFPIENRATIEQNQNLADLAKYISAFSLPGQFLQLASNFHFIVFLATNHFVEFEDSEVKELAAVVAAKDAEGARKWAKQNPNWGTLSILIQSGGAGGSSPNITSTGSAHARSEEDNSGPKWNCPHCTMLNPASNNECLMCNLPKNSQ